MLQDMSLVNTVIPFTAMILVECTDVCVSTLSKAAMAKGMNNLVFVVYSNALATLLLLPFVIYPITRSKLQAPLSFSLICGFFLLGLIGTVGQILVYIGIKYSSPALLSAMANLIPIFTFLLAVAFRMEKLDLKRRSSKAKCLGTILAVSGAFIITLYKGPILIMPSSSTPSLSFMEHSFLKKPSWAFGGLLFAIVCLLSATWNIGQASMVKNYPEKMTVVFFFTFFVTLQSTTFSVIMERNPTVWKLRADIEMVAIVFSAIFGSVFRIGIHTWCLQKKGPVYVAMFKPLGMVVAMVLVVTFLGERLFLGRVMGSIIIGFGFYSVIWGQIKEQDLVLSCSDSESSDQTQTITSLLQHVDS